MEIRELEKAIFELFSEKSYFFDKLYRRQTFRHLR